MTEDQWENLCRRCGLCCFEKYIDGNRVIHTPIACRHLDIVTRECRVYDKRFSVGEGCVQLTPEVVGQVKWLPDDCAYWPHAKKRQAR
ncbi:hypothetical protein SAMN05660860_02937 [Geoalkalibacter ferrihydriticus]|uniref:YcgN family cysteine cluster protein n=2 Tax=Geoalkalibacter ferrihydriticus TaxID=392333 RepID=A0A0C2HLD1_9BACT|nr:hypothetical protein [Geoalkalibacter ferrihydriticus]KIH75800.1 hypothetical protein GFER_14490 [Geoalkalibacter ferrihydriticus DSM 17813]SDM65624.1 hypothetical protein SAMN05660860_02937 [Geoalkalibacter ferrihydriticus]